MGLILVGPYQIAGLIAARIVGAITLFVLSFYLSQKYYPLDHRWGAIARLASAAIVWAVIGQAIRLDSLALEIAIKAVALAGFVALAFLLVGGWTHLRAPRGVVGSPGIVDQEPHPTEEEPDPTTPPSDPPWAG